jgi:hypothetical protein
MTVVGVGEEGREKREARREREERREKREARSEKRQRKVFGPRFTLDGEETVGWVDAAD